MVYMTAFDTRLINSKRFAVEADDFLSRFVAVMKNVSDNIPMHQKTAIQNTIPAPLASVTIFPLSLSRNTKAKYRPTIMASMYDLRGYIQQFFEYEVEPVLCENERK